jgi:hypothetical protein
MRHPELKNAVDWDQFGRAYLKVRNKYLGLKGVLGVGYGRGEKDELVLIVLANKKLASEELFREDLVLDDISIIVREPRVGLDIERHSESHHDLMMIDWCQVHKMHLEELANGPAAPPPETTRYGQVFVIKDNGTLLISPAVTVFDSVDWAQAYIYFLQHWGDDYDFVAMIVDHASGMPNNIPSFGDTVFNDITGINHWKDANQGNFDNRACYGTTRLQGLEVLWPFPGTPATTKYVRLMEIAHRWGAYVRFKKNQSDTVSYDDLLDGDLYHWGRKFCSDTSPLESSTFWKSTGGTYSPTVLNDHEYEYNELDLYLMGMLDPSETSPFYFFDGLSPASMSPGAPTALTLQNIKWAHNWRNPTAADSQRSFRQAYIVLTKDLVKGATLAQRIEADRIAHNGEFRASTRSRAVLDTYLYEDSYDGIHIKDNTADTGDDGSTGEFWNSPDIWVRNQNTAGLIHQNTIRGQDNWIYVRVRNKGNQASKEITVNVFRANFVATQFLYPQDWRMEDQVGSQVIAAGVPANDEIILEFKWDQSMIPPETGWHPCLLAEVLPINRDVVTTGKLHHVWENRRIAQKNITIVNPPLGTSSLTFPFCIGAGSLPSRWIRIHVVQKQGPPFTEIGLRLGLHQNDLITRVDQIQPGNASGIDISRVRSTGMSTFCRGGQIIDRQGLTWFVISDGLREADIALPLHQAERLELTLRLDWHGRPRPTGARFEITERDDQNKTVGGVTLVVGRLRETFLKKFLTKIARTFWPKIRM